MTWLVVLGAIGGAGALLVWHAFAAQKESLGQTFSSYEKLLERARESRAEEDESPESGPTAAADEAAADPAARP